MKLLDRLPWIWLMLIAAWMAVAPGFPEPHLVEKVRMLTSGTLTKALDIFDLIFHVAPLLVLLATTLRWAALRRTKTST
jgi:hypothetical protein